MTEAAVAGTPPAPPANAIEARAQLDAKVADKDWGARLLAGDANATKEFRDLNAKLANEDDSTVAAALKGDIGDMPDASVKLMANTAGMLREIGIREEVIEQTLRNQPVTAAEYKLVEAWKARQMKDPEFVRAYLSGEPEAREKMTLCNIVLSSEIKKDEAA